MRCIITMDYIGRCLCNNIQITQNIYSIYHCHCSLCRKQSGTDSHTATTVNINHFKWLCGEAFIQKYQKESGFCSHFCQICGSPIPNQIRSSNDIWIPLGLLEQDIKFSKRFNFCISAKAS